MLDRLEEELEQAMRSGNTADALMPKLVSLLGCDHQTLERVLTELGWKRVAVGGGEGAASVWRVNVQPRREKPAHRNPNPANRREKLAREQYRDSPFAQLKTLLNAN